MERGMIVINVEQVWFTAHLIDSGIYITSRIKSMLTQYALKLILISFFVDFLIDCLDIIWLAHYLTDFLEILSLILWRFSTQSLGGIKEISLFLDHRHFIEKSKIGSRPCRVLFIYSSACHKYHIIFRPFKVIAWSTSRRGVPIDFRLSCLVKTRYTFHCILK